MKAGSEMSVNTALAQELLERNKNQDPWRNTCSSGENRICHSGDFLSDKPRRKQCILVERLG